MNRRDFLRLTPPCLQCLYRLLDPPRYLVTWPSSEVERVGLPQLWPLCGMACVSCSRRKRIGSVAS